MSPYRGCFPRRRRRRGLPEDRRTSKRTTRWYVHIYLHADDPSVLPIGEASLDRLRVGGKRNYGYGEIRLKDTRVVELDELEYSRLETADEYLIELLTPFVLGIEYPGVNGTTMPTWWDTDGHGPCRRRTERLVHQCRSYVLETIDHGNGVMYVGDEPVQTAMNGIRHIGPHSKFGVGKFRVIPIESLEARL